jgi:hypothetical protein
MSPVDYKNDERHFTVEFLVTCVVCTFAYDAGYTYRSIEGMHCLTPAKITGGTQFTQIRLAVFDSSANPSKLMALPSYLMVIWITLLISN